jgi:mannose-6-phosphate isomerase-like protein (cupin superfamily)
VLYEFGHGLFCHLGTLGKDTDCRPGVIKVLKDRSVRGAHPAVSPLRQSDDDQIIERDEGFPQQRDEVERSLATLTHGNTSWHRQVACLSSDMDMLFVDRPAAERFQLGTDEITVLATSAQTRGNLYAVEVKMPPGGGPPVIHQHNPSEIYYVLEGEFTFYVGDTDSTPRQVTAGPGEVVPLPGGTPHTVRNHSDKDAVAFVVHTPGQVMEASDAPPRLLPPEVARASRMCCLWPSGTGSRCSAPSQPDEKASRTVQLESYQRGDSSDARKTVPGLRHA